jgi:hypothetical protein
MFIYKLREKVNNANTACLLFTIFCFFYLNPIVSGNEENYLAWAKAYFEPGWMPNSFVFDHWLGHRYFFENFFGFLLSHFSFETVVVIGRTLASAALAFSVSRLFQQIKLSNLESLLVVVIFIFCGQSFFGGEWIFVGVEPKVFAYPFIFMSITELLKGNLKASTLHLVAATYMHVLAAGWFFVYFFVFLIWSRIPFRELTKLLGLYLAGVLPLAAYLAPKVFSGPSDVNGIHLNWIYVFFRVPHHAAPFIEGKLNWDIERIFAALFCFILALWIQKRKGWPEEIQFFNKFNIIIPTFIFTFILLSYFDTGGDILKFRPFRGTSIFLFFVFIEFILLIKIVESLKRFSALATSLSIATLAILIAYGLGDNINQKYIQIYWQPKKENIAWQEVASFAKNQTEKHSIFLLKGINENISRSFSRLSDRDIFVLKKFVPIDKNKWYEWYQRLQVPIENEEQVAALTKKYKLDYYLTVPSRPGIGEVVFENSSYVIYRLPKNE